MIRVDKGNREVWPSDRRRAECTTKDIVSGEDGSFFANGLGAALEVGTGLEDAGLAGTFETGF